MNTVAILPIYGIHVVSRDGTIAQDSARVPFERFRYGYFVQCSDCGKPIAQGWKRGGKVWNAKNFDHFEEYTYHCRSHVKVEE